MKINKTSSLLTAEKMRQQEFEILSIEDNENDANMTIRSLQKNNVSNKTLHLKDGAIALEYLFGTGILKIEMA